MDEWRDNAKLVFENLKDNKEEHKEIMERLRNIEISIAQLQVKSGIWGAVGALVILFGRHIVTKLTGG